MGWAGFDGGVGGEGGSHALRAQGSNGDAHGRCALRNGSPLANRLRMGQRPPEEKAPPKSTQIKHPNKAPSGAIYPWLYWVGQAAAPAAWTRRRNFCDSLSSRGPLVLLPRRRTA